MANTSREVDLTLQAKVEGAEQFEALGADVRALAEETRKLGPVGEQLATQLEQIGLEAARAATATNEARGAEAAARAEVRAGARAIEDKKDALQLLKAEVKAGIGDAATLKAQENALNLEIARSTVEQRQRVRALQETGAASKAAAAAEADLTQQLQRASAAAKQAGKDAKDVADKTGDAANVMRQLAGSAAAFFGAQQFTQAIVESEQLARSYAAVFGSAQRAGQEMEYVKGTANRLGLENATLAKSYLSLAAATKGTTLEGEQTRQVFAAVVQAMGALGKSSTETELALTAISQIASKGTAAMEELRGQLGEHLPGALQAAAQGAGITTEQLIAMVSNGQVLAADILPALTKGLSDLYAKAPPAEGVLSGWNRLKNVFFETAAAVGDGGASKGLTGALSGLALAVQGADAAIDILGTGIGETVAAIKTGNYELGTGEQQAQKYANALRKTAEAAGFTEKQQDQLTAAIARGAQTAQEAFRASERLAQKQEDQARSALALKAAYAEMAKGSADYTTQAEKELKTREAEGQALTKLAALAGSEIEQRQVAVEVQERQAAAARELALARQVESVIATSHLLALKEEAIRRGDTTEATKREIQEAQKSADAKRAESDASAALARTKRIEAETAKAAAEAYKDNSARVNELRAAAAAAQEEVARLVALQKQGKATAEQVADAQARAAAAVRVYRDALADASAAAERRVQTEQQLAQTAQAQISVELQRAQAAREVATANGDATKMGEAMRREAELQVQVQEQEALSAQRVAQAIREAASAKETEARATGTLTTAKQAEIDAQRRSADLKDIEAQKAGILADKMRDLANSEQARTAALEAQIAMEERRIQLEDRRRALEERKRNAYDTAGNVVNASIDTPESVRNTLTGYGLADDVAAQLAKRFFNGNGTLNYGPGNNLGGTSLSDTLRILAGQTKNTGAPVAAARTVNINMGGTKTRIDVASQQDSDALVGLMRGLESARSTAA